MSGLTRDAVIQEFGQLLGQGNLEHAEKVLRDRIAADPDWPQARQELAKLLMHAGQRTAAVEVLRDAVHQHPTDTSSWCALAVLYLHGHENDAAAGALVRAMLLEPATLFAYENLSASAEVGQIWEKRKLDLLERAILLAPGLVMPRLALAKHWLPLRSNISGIARQTRWAALLDPGSGEAAFLHGMANVVQASSAEAVRYLCRARVAAPGNATVHYHLANAAFLAAEFNLSEAAILDALRLGYMEAKSRFLLGRTLRARGRYDEATRELDHAVDLDPLFAEPRRMVAWTVTPAHFRA